MNEIITRSIEENDTSWLAQFPPDLMDDNEKEVVDFVLEYNRKHSRAPSLKRLMEKFEHFIPYKFEGSLWASDPDPISDVFDQTVQRKLIEISEGIIREARHVMSTEGKVPLDTLGEIERLHVMATGVARYTKFDRDRYFRRGRIDLPFKVINRHIGGLSNGDFMLIAGRLGTGKSTVAQYISKEAWSFGHRVLYISAEMLPADVFSRIDAMIGSFNPLSLRKGRTPEIAEKLGEVFGLASKGEGEIFIPNQRIMTPSQIFAFAKNLSIDLMIVDGAYLLQPSGRPSPSKWERVSSVSNELKQGALEMDIPIIGTVQLKRGVSGKDAYDPEDISYSDALGQDADFILAIKQNKVMPERSELHLIKNRYGSGCAASIYVDFDTMRVVDESVEGKAGKPGRVSLEDW